MDMSDVYVEDEDDGYSYKNYDDIDDFADEDGDSDDDDDLTFDDGDDSDLI